MDVRAPLFLPFLLLSSRHGLLSPYTTAGGTYIHSMRALSCWERVEDGAEHSVRAHGQVLAQTRLHHLLEIDPREQ
jgi:hypothetical protein